MRTSLIRLSLSLCLALAATFAWTSSASALNPSRTYKQRPDKFNMKYTASTVTTADGAKLKVWTFPSKEKGGEVVLIAHNGEGNMGDYLRRVDQFTSLGFTVVTFDYRGFGESSEFEIDTNMAIYPHFLKDMAAMFDHVRKQHSATFSLYGWGIGGGLALGVGFGRPESRAIIADTPFLSMEDLEERFSSWDEPMEVPFAGYEKRFEPKTAVQNAPGNRLQRVTLIVGSHDTLMKPADMQALVKLAKAAKNDKIVSKTVHVIENPDRKDNFRVDTAGYMKAVKTALAPAITAVPLPAK